MAYRNETTFTTAGERTLTVPTGVDEYWFELEGASGRPAGAGAGAYVEGLLPTTPGEDLILRVGGRGTAGSTTGGFNGGGDGGTGGDGDGSPGGGMTDVRQGGSTLSDRVLIAGGGGGGPAGYDAGYPAGSGGTGVDGEGGDQSTGGAGGTSDFFNNGGDGSLGTGGNGGSGGANVLGGHGGGAGFYGGGGGAASDISPGDGAGGSSGATAAASNVAFQDGTNVDADGTAFVLYLDPIVAPSGVTATGGPREISLSWTAGDKIDEQRIYASASGTPNPSTDTPVATVSATATSHTITGLLDGTEYEVLITGARTTTEFGEEEEGTATDTATTDFATITGLVADASVEDQLTISWDDTANSGDYRIQIRVSGSGDPFNDLGTVGHETTQYSIGGLLDGEEYDVRVRHETADGVGAWTEISPVTLLPNITNVQTSVDSGTWDVTLTWTDNADNEDSQEVQRRELSTDSGTPTAWSTLTDVGANAESYLDPNIPVVKYEYRIRVSTEHSFAISPTATATHPTPIPDVDGWQVVAPDLIDPETNVVPRIEDTVYDVDPVVDTANPFGDFAVAKMDDRGGEIFDLYPRGTRIDVYPPNNNTTPRFTGYVVERRENEQEGADVLEIEAYSFDQFLRRNTVTNDQRGNTISQALADIIQTDTPVTYNAANIEVGDDQELTRSYQGEPVENALRDFAFKSTNEDFGVDDDLEFFFRPRETTHIDRGVDNTQWFRYDIPELGKEAINEVEVWFDDGEESVIVDDGTDKLDLQDSLGLPSPGTQRKELQRPLFSDISDAEDVGRKYLAFRNATISGTVTTYGLYDAEPGDTIDITIEPRGIDEEFVIAAIEYRWGVDETILTVVEKRGDVDDILSELSESVQRQEMQGANRDAPKNRITTTNATGIVSVDVDAGGTTADADRFVNDGRNAVRDAWTGAGNPDIANIVVGDNNSGLSRTNTALVNQTNSASVTQSLPSAKVVEFSATITQTGVQEIGLETATGTLIARATFDTPVDLSSDTVTVTLTVSNDDSVSRGVVTNDGQTAVRDVLADNSPTLPTDYGYGSDDTPVAETDTALGNELVSTSLEEILIQSASSESGWNSILGTVASTRPLVVSASGIRPAQTSWTTESSDLTRSGTGLQQDGDYSDGEAERIDGTSQSLSMTFTVEHTIPASDFDVWMRMTTTGPGGTGTGPELTFSVNGDTWTPVSSGAGFQTLDWREFANNTYGGGTNTYSGGDLTPGTYTLTVEGTSSGDGQDIDVVAPMDALTRVTGGGDATAAYTFDNNNGGSSGYLDGPELYPEQLVQSLETATTRRNVSEARFTLTANDTSGDFYVELANDGSTFTRVNNSTSGTVTFASPESGVDTNISLTRYGSRSTATPQTGYLVQEIDDWQLFADIDAVLPDDIGVTLTRAIVPPNTSGIVGQTVREAGLKSGSTLLTRHILAEFDLLTDQRLASSESTRFTSDN